jgi:hypothetical protein
VTFEVYVRFVGGVLFPALDNHVCTNMFVNLGSCELESLIRFLRKCTLLYADLVLQESREWKESKRGRFLLICLSRL